MPVTTVPLRAEALTADTFAPFGWIPVDDTDPADGTETLRFEWADPHLNVIGHAASEIEHADDGAPLCGELFRHDTHTQALMPLTADSVIVVAPASADFSGPGDLDTVHAFRLKPLDVFVLHRGTWHWGPFPVGADVVRLLNVQGLRYAEDNARVDLVERTQSVLEVLA